MADLRPTSPLNLRPTHVKDNLSLRQIEGGKDTESDLGMLVVKRCFFVSPIRHRTLKLKKKVLLIKENSTIFLNLRVRYVIGERKKRRFYPNIDDHRNPTPLR